MGVWDIKPCQSAQTASSERAQCVSGKAHPVERSQYDQKATERYLTTDGTVSALDKTDKMHKTVIYL